MIEIAVIGDVHLSWDDDDRRWFDESGYDALLFVGDLAGYRDDGLRVARSIAKLNKPTFVLPGNHDGVHLAHLAAETFGWTSVARIFEPGQHARCEALAAALHPVPLCGYSRHELSFRGESLTLLAGRPHSHGGPTLAFRSHLQHRFGVRTMADSRAALCRLIDEAESDRIVLLAHNGPAGLGDRRTDIWGCDFKADEGDWGDADLRDAVDHAGERLVALVAGHMHRQLKGGGQRRWLVREQALFINAARVRRHIRRRGAMVRHHVRLRIDGRSAEADEIEVLTA